MSLIVKQVRDKSKEYKTLLIMDLGSFSIGFWKKEKEKVVDLPKFLTKTYCLPILGTFLYCNEEKKAI